MVWSKFYRCKVFILFINTLPHLKLSSSSYGDMSILYAAIPFLNVIFTYGIETAFFRFATKDGYKKDIYSTATISILFSTAFPYININFFRSALRIY